MIWNLPRNLPHTFRGFSAIASRPWLSRRQLLTAGARVAIDTNLAAAPVDNAVFPRISRCSRLFGGHSAPPPATQVMMPLLAQDRIAIPNKDLLSWMFDEQAFDADTPVCGQLMCDVRLTDEREDLHRCRRTLADHQLLPSPEHRSKAVRRFQSCWVEGWGLCLYHKLQRRG
jgi:hypothetical protein